ncbi:MAG TPA: TolC family protein [Bacteroides sp.]|nr:TolC family protein [Bacteroides sp.]
MKRISNSFLLILFSVCLMYGQQDTYIFKYRSQAVEYQQAVKAAQSGLEGANSLLDASKAGFLPKVDMDGYYNFNGVPMQLAATPDSPDGQELSHMYELGLWVSQPVLTGGYLKNTRSLAMARTDVARSFVGLTEQNTMLEADIRYLTVVARKEISELTKKYRDAIGQFEQVIQDRVDEEVVGMNELYQARVRFNDAQYEVISMEKEYKVSLMELNRLIGVPMMTETEHLDSLLVVDWKSPEADRVDKALQMRPEVSLKENEMMMNQFDEKITASYYNPQINVGAGGTYGAPSPGLLTEPGPNYHVNANLAIPIFYWGQKKSMVFAKQQVTEQSKLELERTVDMVTLQVTAAYYELERSQDQVDFAVGALDNAGKNADVMLDRYREGLSSVLEVLDAQLFWQKSYNNYINAKFELNIANSTYLKAMGELSIAE